MTIYLDVRTPAEFETGHYPNALNHDINLLAEGIFPDEHHVPKDADIKTYCRSGGRASMAVQLLKQAGYSHVESIGGYDPNNIPT